MTINLFPHQEEVIPLIRNGSILNGGVGSGKTITSIYYYYTVVCEGSLHPEVTEMKRPRNLFVITTARKRDSLDWEKEAANFRITNSSEVSISGVVMTVDSWNSIGNYTDVKDAFFIFDEQRLVGSGAWVKAFLKIADKNQWILLSATPGDTWSDYIPMFVANKFYRNRTEFCRRHIVYSTYSSFPKIERYIDTGYLKQLKEKITVDMPFEKTTIPHIIDVPVEYDEIGYDRTVKGRWNPITKSPVKDILELGRVSRQIVNSDKSRLEQLIILTVEHPRMIVFYNFDYELELLRTLDVLLGITVAEYNGHKHEPLPRSKRWIYLVQYTSGSEAWNCVETDTIVFYSLTYSYRVMQQCLGRIDRLNTKFKDLYYYRLVSGSQTDKSILSALTKKKEFNERKFLEEAFGWGYTSIGDHA